MQLNEQDIRNYMEIVKAKFGVDLAYEAAAKEANNLITLFAEFMSKGDNEDEKQ